MPPAPIAGNIIANNTICLGDIVTINSDGDAGGQWFSSNQSIATISNSGLITSLSLGKTILSYKVICAGRIDIKDFEMEVVPLPKVNAGEVTIADVCLGNDAIGTILNPANLTDGTYTVTYNLSGNNTALNQTTTIAVSGSKGTFNIPNVVLSNSGLTTMTITGIKNNLTNCFTLGLSVKASFSLIQLPNVSGVTISIATTCVNTDVYVTIKNAIGLTPGTYKIIYELSGANSSSGNSETLLFNSSGASSFTIPKSLITNGGPTTITIQDFIYSVTQCGANTVSISPVVFGVTDPATPTLNPQLNLFCIQNNPTIKDLSTNVNAGTYTLIWYNTPSGGTAYTNQQVLVNGATYYAASRDTNGCESSIRLEVMVDLTGCDQLFVTDGFSPNGDGVNDEFYVKDLELLYPKFQLEIYNRYGNMLYKGDINTPRFNGTPNQSTFDGKEIVPTGVYFYILYFNDPNKRAPKQGRLYLSR